MPPARHAVSSLSADSRPYTIVVANSAATGATVDGIRCESSEQVLYHIHAHLAVYVNGSARTVPQGIGIASCARKRMAFSS